MPDEIFSGLGGGGQTWGASAVRVGNCEATLLRVLEGIRVWRGRVEGGWAPIGVDGTGTVWLWGGTDLLGLLLSSCAVEVRGGVAGVGW